MLLDGQVVFESRPDTPTPPPSPAAPLSAERGPCHISMIHPRTASRKLVTLARLPTPNGQRSAAVSPRDHHLKECQQPVSNRTVSAVLGTAVQIGVYGRVLECWVSLFVM